jgi:putative tryptophan/tyrosine transport system substrate-binding protein
VGTSVLPVAARTQQRERLRRIGILWPQRESDPVRAGFDAALKQGLAERGWVEGRNLQIDARYVGESPDKVGVLIKELVDLHSEILVTGTVRLTRAMQEQTRTIPIVIAGAGDPLASGLVKSLSHPDGNTTGITDIFPSIGGKWLELLTQCVPELERVAVIVNPDRSNLGSIVPAIKAAASPGVKVIETQVRTAEEIEHAIVEFAAAPRGGLVIVPLRSCLPSASLSTDWRSGTGCRSSIRTGRSLLRAACCRTVPTCLICSGTASLRT